MSINKKQELVGMVESLIDRILYLEKGYSLEVEGQTLFPTEIHLLLLVAGGQPGNATQMAERMGVTKGAISQTLTRLERKGMLIKSRDPANKNELNLDLTSVGQRAAQQARDATGHIQRQYSELLAGFNATEKEVIGKFLTTMNRIFGSLD